MTKTTSTLLRKSNFFDRSEHMTPTHLPSPELALQLERISDFRLEELRMIFSLLPDAVLLADEHRRIMRVGPGFSTMFGYEAIEVVGRTTQILYASMEGYITQGQVRFNPDANAGPEPFQCEFRRKNGDTFVAELRATAIRNKRGRSVGFLGVIKDITLEQRISRERDVALRRQERRAKRMQMLHDVSTKDYFDVGSVMREVLRRSCRILDMEMGLISSIEGDVYTVKFTGDEDTRELEGTTFNLGQTYCTLTINQPEQVLAINHMKDSTYSGHPCYQTFALESYIGVGIRVGGALYGTLNFSSTHKRQVELDAIDLEYIELLGSLVSSLLGRHHFEQTLRRERDFLEGLADLQRRLATTEHNAKELLEVLTKHGRKLLGALSMSIELADGTLVKNHTLVAQDPKQPVASIEAPLIFNDETLGTITLEMRKEDRRHANTSGLELVAGVAAARLRDLNNVEQSKSEAITDPLTNILNRRGFLLKAQQHFNHIIMSTSTMGLAVFDIDHFKQVNDHHGHLAGDGVIQALGAILKHEPYAIVGRWGGEEFVVVWPEKSKHECLARCEYIRNTFSTLEHTSPNQATFHVTLSGGLAMLSHTTDSIQEMFELADKALYTAKSQGRDCIHGTTLDG